MNPRRLLVETVAVAIVAGVLGGCGALDDDFRSGVYWLEKEHNGEMAAKAFQRSLNRNPKRWKTRRRMFEALALTDDAAKMERQVQETLTYFPDSAWSADVVGPASSMLGRERYNSLAAGLELKHIGNLLASKGDKPRLLARGVIAGCRAGDTTIVRDYFKRLLTVSKDGSAPDSVVQEMNFFAGPALVHWLRNQAILSSEPDNVKALESQVELGLLMGNHDAAKDALAELARVSPETVTDPDFYRRFGILAGADPFNTRILVQGRDGAFSPDGSRIVYIRERGDANAPDPYIYTATATGRNAKPLLKATQQFLKSLALPRYSPDGRWIYFYGSPERNWTPGAVGRFNLYRVRPWYNAASERLTDADILPVIPHFETDGSLLLVRRDVGSARASVEIVRLNPGSRALEPVSRIGEPVSGATFTPSGDSLLLITDRGVFRRSVKGGAISVDLRWQGFLFPLLSPDGRYLRVSEKNLSLLLIDRTDGSIIYLGKAAKPFGGFGPGNRLLVTRQIQKGTFVTRLDLGAEAAPPASYLEMLKKP